MVLKTYLIASLLAATSAAVQIIPSLGLGTWLSDREKVPHAVEFGLKNGYTHIDAAWIYRKPNSRYLGKRNPSLDLTVLTLSHQGNEDQTGKGIAASGFARDDIWVTSKLWNTFHQPSHVRPALEESLARLNLTYVDLYLIHWPVAFLPGTTDLDTETTLLDTWRALEDLVRANLTRHIGLSNFAQHDVELILSAAEIAPYAHEFETHPYLQQQAFVDFHHERGVKVIAYSPLGNTNPTYTRHGAIDPLLKDPFWIELAEKKGATPAQVVLAWGIQRGTIVIPKSTSEKHLLQNLEAEKIEFTEEELADIAASDKKARFSNPSKAWGVQLFSDLDDHLELDLVEEEL